MLMQNTDFYRRAWSDLSDATGHTLELGPGETADVALPEGFTDPFLRPVSPKKKMPAPEPAASPDEMKE